MNKQFHIRGVNPKTHKVLTQRAEEKGLSITQYLNNALDALAAREDQNPADRKAKLWEALKKLPDLKTSMTGVELVREDRDNR